MRHEDEMVTLQCQVGILATHVGKMIRAISVYNDRGWNTDAAQAKLAVLENLMWKLHSRHVQLKAGIEQHTAKRILH